MKKRILAVLLVLAMIVVAGVVAVSANPTTLSVEETIAAAYVCPCHETPIDEITDWVEFTNTTVMADGGHYRMAAAVTMNDDSVLTSNVYTISSGKMVLDTNGFTLNAKSASYRVFSIAAGVELTIVDTSEAQTGKVRGGGNGGAAISLSGTLNLFGSQLGNRRNTPATTPGNGGVISLSSGAVFNMYGGELVPANGTNTGQIAQKGGAVYIAGGSTYNLYGGVVNSVKVNTDNAGANGGDAIYIGSSTAKFNMYGGTVNGLGYGNSPAGESVRGAICQNGNSDGAHIMGGTINGSVYLLYANNTIKISGDPVIECVDAGRMTDDSQGGIVLGEGGVTGGRIGVIPKLATSNTFISNKNTVDVASSAPYFYGYTIRANAAVTEDARLELVANNHCEHCDGDATWTAWSGDSATMKGTDANGGHYFLVGHIAADDGQAYVGEADVATVTVCVDMYGHSVTKNAKRVFAPYNGSTLNLMNSASIESVLTTAYTDTGAVINLAGTSNLNLYDGLTFASVAECGAGGNVQVNTGTFTMYGGTLNGGNAAKGGAVYVNGGTFTMEDGEINGSAITGNGGAIGASGDGASVVINGGTINGGSATYGGAIYLENSSSLTMTNGTIAGGTADQGGNIYMTASTAEISGGIVEDGTTNKKQIAASTTNTTLGGGNILVTGSASELTISGNASIQDGRANAASSDSHRGGGNIFINSGTVNITGGTVKDGTTNASGGNIMTRGGTLNISGTATISGGTAGSGSSYGGDSIALRDNTTVITGGTINSIAPVRDGYTSLTISGAPTIASLDLVGHVNDGVAPVITLGEGGVTGGSITVNVAENTSFSVASELAETSKNYFHNTNEELEISVVDNTLVFVVYVAGPISAYCEHCGVEAGEQTWLPLTAESYTATGSSATLPGGHYYLAADLSNANRVNLSEGKICLDLHGKTLTNTSLMPFWVKGTGDLGVMDTVGSGELQGSAGNGYGGGVIRMTGGTATVYGGTLRYVGTKGADNGGVVFVNAASFIMKGGHLTDGYCTVYTNSKGETCSAQGGIIYVSGEGSATIEGGTMALGNAEGGCNGIYLENNHSTLNVDAAATEVLELLDGNVTGNAYSPMNMPYGIGLATVNEDVLCTWYADTAEAMTAYDETVNYLKVLGNTGDLTLDGAYFVDLAGNSIAITGGTVYGMDSANDAYDAALCGIATVEAPETYCVAPNGNLYITVSEGEGQYSFHRLTMVFKRLSLRPGAAGIYYSSSWTADEVLVDKLDNLDDGEYAPVVTGYGMALKKNEAATGDSFENGDKFAYTYFDNMGGNTSVYLTNKNGKEINSCLLSNIISTANDAQTNQDNAQVDIFATPYVAFTNYNDETEYVMGPTYGNDLKGIVEWVVSEIAAMEDADARAKNIEKISTLETFADECGVTFEGLAELINPEETTESTESTEAAE